jgi:hypothetical protein
MENKMVVKLLWKGSSEFIVEGQDGYFIEASAEETRDKILPALSAHERMKFDHMKDIYVATKTSGIITEGCYYFLVSCDAQTVKFESAEFLTTDLSTRGGKISSIPDLQITTVEEICSI